MTLPSTFRRLLATMVLPVLLAAHGPATAAAAARYDWVVSSLYNFNHPMSSQLPFELATKMSKMAASPFAFYRGSAHLFYQDMVTRPASSYCSGAGNQTWLNGDLHLQNMGGLRDASGNFVFDTNDFDESYWGPYVWDLRRMAVSIVLAARENGLSSSNQVQLVRDYLDNYINKMSEFRGTDKELGYRLDTSNTSGVVKDTIQKSAGQSTSSFLAKSTQLVSGTRQFISAADLVALSAANYSAVQIAVNDYVNSIPTAKRYASSYYRVKDIRQKLGSGIGSLGRYRYYVLIEGPSSSQNDDIILQLKQEASSAVAIANAVNPSPMPAWVYDSHQGQRAAKSMKANLSNTDALVGWTTLNGQPYLVREKSPYEADFDTTQLTSYSSFSSAIAYFGKVTAKNHASSDKDYDAALSPYSMDKEIDALISINPIGFKDEIVNFAVDYANQVQLDWQSFKTARTNGVPLY